MNSIKNDKWDRWYLEQPETDPPEVEGTGEGTGDTYIPPEEQASKDQALMDWARQVCSDYCNGRFTMYQDFICLCLPRGTPLPLEVQESLPHPSEGHWQRFR